MAAEALSRGSDIACGAQSIALDAVRTQNCVSWSACGAGEVLQRQVQARRAAETQVCSGRAGQTGLSAGIALLVGQVPEETCSAGDTGLVLCRDVEPELAGQAVGSEIRAGQAIA